MQRPEPARLAATVQTRADAERLADSTLAATAALQAALEQETARVRVGRIREGLADQDRKAELAGAYLRAVETVRANAVALARLAPQAVQRLKAAQAGFAAVVEANRLVLATARAVSEGLVKGAAEEMSRGTQLRTYGPPGAAPSRPAAAGPLSLSRRL